MAFEPTQFGKYTLYEKLAVGGMAIIYRGRIQGVKGFQKDLVIKQILPQYSGMNDFIDMFIDEAKIAVNLNHANIVPVYELGEIDGQLYIAMEYVSGKDIQAILEACEERKIAVPPRIAAYILTGVARGLDYAHNKKDDATRQPLNIIHRDISPNNVIVSNEGEVKIIDFGIAKASIKVSVTQFGTLKGKMIYMSPEQAAEGKLDPRSDVFSAGILLYELCTGKKPYGGDNFAVTQENVKKAAFAPPDKVNPALPPGLTAAIMRAMAREPNDRFAGAFEFERALSDFVFSTGQQVYARDVALFMTELFSGAPVTGAQTTAGASSKVPTVSNIRNLTDPSGKSVPELTPTDASITSPGGRVEPAEVPRDTGTGAGLVVPDEGAAIEDSSFATPRAAAAADGYPFDEKTERPPSKRDTVVTRMPPSRAGSIPASSAESITPPPRDGGVVPAARSSDPTRTAPPARGVPAMPPLPIPSWLEVDKKKAGRKGAIPVAIAEVEEETVPGSIRSRPAPTPVSSRGRTVPPPPPAPARYSEHTPAGGHPRAQGVQPPPATSSGKQRTDGTPSAGTRAAQKRAPAPWEEARGGPMNRVVSGMKSTPAAADPVDDATVLEGSYESPQDFLSNSYATYGDRRGLFLSTTQLDTKLGVDIPLDILFRSPPANFRVHGRVIWRRAKEGTSKGRRLPAGLAIEFVEGLDDDREALFAYLGLP